jgi:hypothetical protein
MQTSRRLTGQSVSVCCDVAHPEQNDGAEEVPVVMGIRSATRLAWLSLTPEPELLLPAPLALLRRPGTTRAERARIEGLVLHGSRRTWIAGLDEAVWLINRAARDVRPEEIAPALEAAAVLHDHCRMLIGLPGDLYRRTAPHRAALALAERRLRHHLATSSKEAAWSS